MGTPAEVLEQPLAQARHKLTVTEFQRMGEAGILDEDDRVELIDGAIYDMAPIGSRHAAIVDFLVERLTLSAKGRVLVRGQGPLQIPPYNEPLPDVLLLKPRADRYRDSLPQSLSNLILDDDVKRGVCRVVWHLLARSAVIRLRQPYTVLVVERKPLGPSRWHFRVVLRHGCSM